MPLGPGKYDALCSMVRLFTDADAALIVVINGGKGSGFSVQAPAEVQAQLPALLETLARQIRLDLEQQQAESH